MEWNFVVNFCCMNFRKLCLCLMKKMIKRSLRTVIVKLNFLQRRYYCRCCRTNNKDERYCNFWLSVNRYSKFGISCERAKENVFEWKSEYVFKMALRSGCYKEELKAYLSILNPTWSTHSKHICKFKVALCNL